MTKYKLTKMPSETQPCMIRSEEGIYYSVGEVNRKIDELEKLIVDLGKWVCCVVAYSGNIVEADRTMMDKVREITDRREVLTLCQETDNPL